MDMWLKRIEPFHLCSQILLRHPGRKVLIVSKENQIGLHLADAREKIVRITEHDMRIRKRILNRFASHLFCLERETVFDALYVRVARDDDE